MPTQTLPLPSTYMAISFEAELLTELAGCTCITLAADTELRREEQTSVRYTPIVLKGSIRVTRVGESGKELLMYNIRPGESCFLNIVAALNQDFGSVDSLRAVAEQETTMVLITDGQIRAWNDKYASWRRYTAKLFNARFVEFFSWVDAVAFRSISSRLAEALQTLANPAKEVALTHQELAFKLGTAREVVSRQLKEWEREGKVQIARGSIKLLGRL